MWISCLAFFKLSSMNCLPTCLLCMIFDSYYCCSKENADFSTKVYVGGIPYYSNEDDIRSFFEGCGTITEVDCMTFPDTGKFRGIAIINFKVGFVPVGILCYYVCGIKTLDKRFD